MKNFDFPKNEFKVYHFCKICKERLEFANEKILQCPRCQSLCKKKDNDNFFMHIPLKPQLEEMVKSDLYCSLRKNCDESDVINGSVYKQFREKGIIGDNDLSTQFNVDGVNFARSSKKSMWPILVGVNELPYRLRKNNLYLCGLWYGKKKPPMNLYLKPFVEEMKELYNNGIECIPFGSEEPITIKVHTLFCSVDSVARPLCQNMKQFNGKYGCGYCMHEGVKVGKNKRIFPFNNNISPRNAKQYLKHVKSSVKRDKAVKGVKGPSILSLLPNFDMIHCFPPDYMHAWLLGVAKLFTTTWLDSKNKDEPFYLGSKKDEFNDRLLNFLPPSEITRTPQPIWDGYKANEWKNFVIYSSVVCLKDLLPSKYLKHWELFVFSLSLVNKNEVNENDIQLCQKALEKFVMDAESLYGQNYI